MSSFLEQAFEEEIQKEKAYDKWVAENHYSKSFYLIVAFIIIFIVFVISLFLSFVFSWWWKLTISTIGFFMIWMFLKSWYINYTRVLYAKHLKEENN